MIAFGTSSTKNKNGPQRKDLDPTLISNNIYILHGAACDEYSQMFRFNGLRDYSSAIFYVLFIL